MSKSQLEVVTNELVLPVITWNKDEVNKEIKELEGKYATLVFDAKQLPQAKKDVAKLRKTKTNLNDEKKKVKSSWNENYTVFENEIKDSMGVLETLIVNVNEQVQEFEDKLKKERELEIKALDEFEAISEYITFDSVWLLKKWVSKDDKTLKDLFVAHLEQITTWKSTITMMANSHDLVAEDYVELLKTKDYEFITNRIVGDADLLKRNNEREVKPAVDIPRIVINKDAKPISVLRRLTGTKEQLVALKEYADKIGVIIERVE